MCVNCLRLVNPKYRKIERDFEDANFGSPNYKERFSSLHRHNLVQPDYLVSVPCGKCNECRSLRASSWRFRLFKECELGRHQVTVFVTLTIEPRYLKFAESNPGKIVRVFCENYRQAVAKKYPWRRRRPSLRHWFVAEYGTRGTKRLHLHGLIWDPLLLFGKNHPELESCWPYGFSDFSVAGHSSKSLRNGNVTDAGKRGDFCALYVVKYINKPQSHIGSLSGRVWCSPGIGKCYLTPEIVSKHRSSMRDAQFVYVGNFRYSLPRYYRHKIFSDEERYYMLLMVTEERDFDARSVSGYRKLVEFNIDLRKRRDYYNQCLRRYYEVLKPCFDSMLTLKQTNFYAVS